MMLYLFLDALLLVQFAFGAGFSSLSASCSPTTAGATAEYTIRFTPSVAIPTASTVRFTFPSTITLTNASPYSCSFTSGYLSTGVCSVTSNVVTITGSIPSTSLGVPFVVRLPNITNPPTPEPTSAIQVIIENGSTIVASETSNSNMIIRASARNLSNATLSPGSDVIGESSTWTLNITPAGTIKAGSSVEVTFPYWNANIPNVDYYIDMIDGTPVCDDVTNIDSTLSCSYSTSTRKLTIINGFGTDRTGLFTFTIAMVKNPPNSDTITAFDVQIIFNNIIFERYNSSTNTLQVKVTTPNVISGFVTYAGSTGIYQSTSITIDATLTNPVYSTCTLDIVLPSEMSTGGTLALTNIYGLNDSMSYTQSGQTISITNCFTSSTRNSITLSIANLTNPQTTKPTSSFTIRTRQPNRSVIDQSFLNGLTATPGQVTQDGSTSYVSFLDSKINSVTTYIFTFRLTYSVPNAGVLVIVFPNQIKVAARSSSTSCVSPITGLSVDAKCQVVGQTLTVLNGFSSFSGGRVSFRLDQVTNPSSSQTTDSFTITSYEDSSLLYKIDASSDSITVTAEPTPLQSVLVTSSSTKTGEVSTFTFTILPSSPIPRDGYIIIEFPSKVTITDTTTASNNCVGVRNIEGTLKCVCTTTTVRLNDGFKLAQYETSSGAIVVTVPRIMNPPSTKAYQSFSVTIYDKDNYRINQSQSGISIQPTEANSLRAATVSIGSLVNGAQTVYTFSFTTFNEVDASFKVLVSTPSQVTMPTTAVCSAISGMVSISCTESSNNIEATLTLSAAASGSTLFSFSIANVKNPPSTAASSTFKLYTKTTDGYDIDKRESGLTVQTTTAATIRDITISASSTAIGATTNYLISYTPENVHPVGSTLFITVPTDLTFSSISCTSAVLSASLTCSSSANIVILSQGFSSDIASPNKITFSLIGIKNPASTITSSPWLIESKTGSSLIDISNDKTTTFTCISPCKTCINTGDFCTSCDTSSSFPYFYDNKCNAACKTDEVDDINTTEKVCVKCSSPCLTCSSTPSNCESCQIGGATPYKYNGTCNANCLDNQWGDGSQCYSCKNPCLTCTSDTACMTCTARTSNPNIGSLTYLYQTSCLAECPEGFLENSTTLKCDQCSTSCKDCSGSLTTCSSCPTGKFLKGTECVDSCPNDGTYITTTDSCLPCISPCATCSTTVNTCTSCISGKVLYLNVCRDSCPDGTVNINNICQPCTGSCATCTVATNVCLSCKDNKLLKLNSCVDDCGSGWVQVGTSCSRCSGCLTCVDTPTTCTSCSTGKFLLDEACVDSCPADIYIGLNRQCLACESPCATCQGTVTNCKTCEAGKKLYNGQCLVSCGAGTVDINNICYDCTGNCDTCTTNTSTCTTCKTSFYLQETSCVDACSFGYILIGNKCEKCNAVCLNCAGTTSTCTSCTSNTYLYSNTCLTACPESYMPVSGVCQAIPETECNTGCTIPLLNNSSCDPKCNILACNYDNGKCNAGPTVCPDGQYQTANECFPCSSSCNTCTSANFCRSCKDSTTTGSIQLLYEGVCHDTCPTGTVKNGIICEACNSTCKTCQGTKDTCTSCIEGLYLYNNQCINSCITGTTIQVGDTCVDCSLSCATCSGTISTCTSCAAGRTLHNNQCLTTCPDGFTTITGSNSCVACDSTCLTCKDTISNCVTCSDDKFFYQNSCISSCPLGTYSIGSVCTSCPSSCVACSGHNTCSSCANGFVKYTTLCLTACPAGYQSNNGVCEVIPPDPECGPGCTSAMLSNGACDELCNIAACNADNQDCAPSGVCPSGQYFTGSTCATCQNPCKTCDAPTSCTSCLFVVSGEYAGKNMLLYNNNCYDTCPSGTLQSGLLCEPCVGCKECAGTTTTCTACESAQFLYNGQCLTQCPADTTVAVGSICIPCSNTCATCSNLFDSCTSCPAGRVLVGTTCSLGCPDGFTTTTTSPNSCIACQGDCATCTGTTLTCTSCKNSMKLYGNTCISACPADTTVEKDSTCLICESPCVKCSGEVSVCTSCQSGFSLLNSKCIASCPTGWESRLGVCEKMCAEGCSANLLVNSVCDSICNYEDCNYDNGMCIPVTGNCKVGQYQDVTTCKDCVYPCNTCSSSVFCSSCRVSNDGTNTQLLLQENTCLMSCSSGYMRDGLICKKCDSPCAECSGTTSTCTACAVDMKLYGTTCINACPLGTTVEVNGVCQPCNINCKTCSGSVNTCTSCNTGAVLSAGTCVLECPSGFTTTTTSLGRCETCEPNCKTCLGDTSFCTSCNTGLILHSNTCISDCPSTFVATVDNPTRCTSCSTACLDCTERIDKCTSCPANNYLTSVNTCQTIATCPTGTTLTPTSNNVCLTCLEPCLTCSGSTTSCTSCVAGLVLENNVCKACTSPCKECRGLATACTACVDGYYLAGTSCIKCSDTCLTCEDNASKCTSCASNRFLSGTTCLNCSTNCASCSGTASNCTSCPTGFFLENGSCVTCNPLCKTCEVTSTRCTSCNSRFYYDNFTCIACNSNCKECSGSATTCTECDTGRSLINGVCGVCKSSCGSCVVDFNTCATCPSGKTLLNGECGVCDSSCSTCITDFNTCGTCPTARFLQNGKCVGCDSNCKTCETTPSNCTSCNDPLSLINGKCEACTNNCKKCSGTTSTCTECTSPFMLIGNECLTCDSTCKTCSGRVDLCTSCPDGRYLSSNTCIKCSDGCLTCATNENNCTSCPIGSELLGGACVIACPDTYIRIGGVCTQCDANCKTCQGAADKCTSCFTGFLFNSVCVTSCPEGYYKSSLSCEKCSSNCYECSGSSTSCLSCNEGYKLVGTKCVQICDEGEYLDSNICLECSSNCKTCLTSATNCQSCNGSSEVVNSKGQCEVPCTPGFVKTADSGGVCIACNAACQTCSGTTLYCTSCSDSGKLLYQGQCLETCPPGKTVPVGAMCVECSRTCVTCAGSSETCTSCTANRYLYNGLCLSECPSGYEPGTGGSCQVCADLTNCPYVDPEPDPDGDGDSDSDSDSDGDGDNDSGVDIDGGNSTDTTTNSTSSSSEEFERGPIPFPFTGSTIVGGAAAVVIAMASPATSLLSTTIGIWGVTGALSWGCVGGFAPYAEDEGELSRRLLELDPTGGSLILTIAIFLIWLGIAFHIALNVTFFCYYCCSVLRKDITYRYWRRMHRCSSIGVPTIGLIISFHVVRFIYCKLCNLGGTSAQFDDKSRLLRPLIRCTYVGLICSHLPIIGGCVLLLLHFEMSNIIWMMAVDSLFVTICLSILLICELKRNEKELVRLEIQKDAEGVAFNEVDETKVVPDQISELRKLLPSVDFSKLVPDKVIPVRKVFIKKGRSRSVDSKRPFKPRFERRHSFPLDMNDNVEINPELFVKKDDEPVILDEPYAEEQAAFLTSPKRDLHDSLWKDESTILLEDLEKPRSPVPKLPTQEISSKDQTPREATFRQITEPMPIEAEKDITPMDDGYKASENPQILFEAEQAVGESAEAPIAIPILKRAVSGEFSNKELTSKNPQSRPKVQRYFPLNLQNTTEEVNEYEEYSEGTHFSEEEPNEEVITDPDSMEMFGEANIFKAAHLGTIEEEKELDFSRAIPDTQDPEIVVVPHRFTGQTFKLKKGFKGARIVDLENKVMDIPVDAKNIDIQQTIVDEYDVHIATLTTHTGQKIKVRRDFKGAKIIDLERRVSNPNAFLIGERVETEEDFLFNNAYPDPEDPEVVIVTHNPTGEDVKIRKTFHGARVVDDFGMLDPEAPLIDRNDYDIPQTLVDKEDVHLATLKHKYTKKRVRVRRDFRGAKIIDLEKKADRPQSKHMEKAEPEPLSMNSSFKELRKSINRSIGQELSPQVSYRDMKRGRRNRSVDEPMSPDDLYQEVRKPIPKSVGKPPRPIRPIQLFEEEPDPDQIRLANLGDIIKSLEQEENQGFMSDLDSDLQYQDDPMRYLDSDPGTPKERVVKKILRKPLYANQDLDKIYGEPAPESRSQTRNEFYDGQDSERSLSRRKSKKSRKMLLGEGSEKLTNIEAIYLQRLHVNRKVPNTNRIMLRGYPDNSQYPDFDYREGQDSYRPYSTDRVLPYAGDQIVNNRNIRGLGTSLDTPTKY